MDHIKLFDLIAPIYAWFYKYQIHAYRHVQKEIKTYNLAKDLKVVDIACGTGALSAILAKDFNHVIAIDGSKKMLEEARRLHKDSNIEFQLRDLRTGLVFEDNSIDLITTAFFLHGLKSTDRLKIMNEMKRVAKRVLIVDYYGKDNLLIRIVEFLENGDYFNFKKQFLSEFTSVFEVQDVKAIHENVGIYTYY